MTEITTRSAGGSVSEIEDPAQADLLSRLDEAAELAVILDQMDPEESEHVRWSSFLAIRPVG